ncbi:response regulator [Gulosibacter bifidus]|uniref:Response regulator n=1 Tax=Gulosibacter bifidus TaxID=272239 RepID=A0ABW5RFY8_9MICO|nr:response regulator transcription factor [Gulosibacter bifidus]
MTELRVVLVDDHPVVRAGLRAVLHAQPQIAVVADAASCDEALAAVAAHQPDVVVTDLRLGDGVDGIETTKRLRALPNPPAVLVLSTYDRDAEIFGAINAGASGYLLKDVPPEEIATAIAAAAAGESYFSSDIAQRVLRGLRNPPPTLTGRERDVLKLLVTGASNREIAKSLVVSEATVKSHLVHIFDKLGVDSRARAIRTAQEMGLV